MSVPRTRATAWDVSAAAGAGEEARSGGWNALETRPIAIRSLRVIPRPRLHSDSGSGHDAVTQLLTLCAVADVSAETLLCAEHTDAELPLPHVLAPLSAVGN